MINRKSLVNLETARAKRAKPNFKRCTFSLKSETVETLKKYSNMSTTIDKMVAYIDKFNINLDDEHPHPRPLVFLHNAHDSEAAILTRQKLLRKKLQNTGNMDYKTD